MAGSPAHRQVIDSTFTTAPETARFTHPQAIIECFRALHPVLKEKYFLNPREDDKDPYESSQLDMLIANRHGIFCLSTLRDAYEFSRYWAIGSGGDFALGALHALYDQDLDARTLAERAVAAACEFDKSSAVPITCHTVTLG
jgi:ATP-dependent protease HslVU (ClpYQ) peptidase subunit